MKKKPGNKPINLDIHIKGTHRTVKLVVGQHTFIKEIENMVAENLNLDLLRTSLFLQH